MQTTSRPARFILLGPPGVGKGTQAEQIAAHFGIVHFSSGEMLRTEAQAGSALGKQAQEFMDRGDLVPDEVLIAVVAARMEEAVATGYVADGFPRTVVQAEEAFMIALRLTLRAPVHAVVSLSAPTEVLVERMTARAAGGSDRADDTEATFRHRLEVYASQTEPLLDYYRDRGVLIEIPATGTPDEVTAALLPRLEAVPLT